jgi:hypothetical protein
MTKDLAGRISNMPLKRVKDMLQSYREGADLLSVGTARLLAFRYTVDEHARRLGISPDESTNLDFDKAELYAWRSGNAYVPFIRGLIISYLALQSGNVYKAHHPAVLDDRLV